MLIRHELFGDRREAGRIVVSGMCGCEWLLGRSLCPHRLVGAADGQPERHREERVHRTDSLHNRNAQKRNARCFRRRYRKERQ